MLLEARNTLDQFEAFLAGLEHDVRIRHRQDMALIVSGDFIAKSPMLGSTLCDAKSRALEGFMASVGLWPENVGSLPTFAVGDRASVIDVTFARLPRGSSIRNWRVRDDVFSDSNHRKVNSWKDCCSTEYQTSFLVP